MRNIELVAPAGSMEKLKAALYFGADAVYLGGKNFGLRAFAQNFSFEEMAEAVNFAHGLGRKVYVTLNIFARNKDFSELKEYLEQVRAAGADAVIVSDLGVFDFVRSNFPDTAVHISTQASILNKHTAKFYERLGAKRLILARELTLEEIAEIRGHLDPAIELEAFVHGAMCISYSGRCLLSNYLTERDSNRGECAQCCRWEYVLVERTRPDRKIMVEEDARGTYFLNSKDLNVIKHIDKINAAGVTGFKIEGRTKSVYYVAAVVNAYRRAVDLYRKNPDDFVLPEQLYKETQKTAHREFTTGFYFNNPEQYYPSSKPKADYEFVAVVKDYSGGRVTVEQRNRFFEGEQLEILSPDDNFLKTVQVNDLKDCVGKTINVADRVQEIVSFFCGIPLREGDILRRPKK